MPGSGGESSARLLHRWQRGLGLGERSRANVDARGLGGDCDLLPGSRVSAVAFLLRRLDPDGQLYKTAETDLCALLSSSSTISSSAPRTRLASALVISERSATAAASCVWVSANGTPSRSNVRNSHARALLNLSCRTGRRE